MQTLLSKSLRHVLEKEHTEIYTVLARTGSDKDANVVGVAFTEEDAKRIIIIQCCKHRKDWADDQIEKMDFVTQKQFLKDKGFRLWQYAYGDRVYKVTCRRKAKQCGHLNSYWDYTIKKVTIFC